MNEKTFFINLWVTMRCNFRCRYCYVKPIYADKDLTIETADAFIEFVKNNIAPQQKLIINFHGGEPMLNFGIIKHIIAKIKRELPDNPSDFGMTTNGSLLNDDDIDYIGKNMHFNCSISIDGKPETMKINRFCCNGKTDYELIEKNAEKLLKCNPNTRIRMTFDRLNTNKLAENICHFIDMGFKTIVPVADYYTDTWKCEDFAEITHQFETVKKYISENKIPDVKLDAISCEFSQLGRCTAGDDYYSIDVFGNIYPCTVLVGDNDWIIGDIYNGLKEEMLKKISDINDRELEECCDCEMYSYCTAVRCRFINYATSGDYYNPNPVTCNMMNVKVALCE